jgi:hypothetical protein
MKPASRSVSVFSTWFQWRLPSDGDAMSRRCVSYAVPCSTRPTRFRRIDSLSYFAKIGCAFRSCKNLSQNRKSPMGSSTERAQLDTRTAHDSLAPQAQRGERILRMKPSRFEPMNRMICEVFSLAPIGGEGWGEGAIRSALRFMGRGFNKKNHDFLIAPPLPDPLLHCVEERESMRVPSCTPTELPSPKMIAAPVPSCYGDRNVAPAA